MNIDVFGTDATAQELYEKSVLPLVTKQRAQLLSKYLELLKPLYLFVRYGTSERVRHILIQHLQPSAQLVDMFMGKFNSGALTLYSNALDFDIIKQGDNITDEWIMEQIQSKLTSSLCFCHSNVVNVLRCETSEFMDLMFDEVQKNELVWQSETGNDNEQSVSTVVQAKSTPNTAPSTHSEQTAATLNPRPEQYDGSVTSNNGASLVPSTAASSTPAKSLTTVTHSTPQKNGKPVSVSAGTGKVTSATTKAVMPAATTSSKPKTMKQTAAPSAKSAKSATSATADKTAAITSSKVAEDVAARKKKSISTAAATTAKTSPLTIATTLPSSNPTAAQSNIVSTRSSDTTKKMQLLDDIPELPSQKTNNTKRQTRSKSASPKSSGKSSRGQRKIRSRQIAESDDEVDDELDDEDYEPNETNEQKLEGQMRKGEGGATYK